MSEIKSEIRKEIVGEVKTTLTEELTDSIHGSGQTRIRKQNRQQDKRIRIAYQRYRRWSEHGFNGSAREIPRPATAYSKT